MPRALAAKLVVFIFLMLSFAVAAASSGCDSGEPTDGDAAGDGLCR